MRKRCRRCGLAGAQFANNHRLARLPGERACFEHLQRVRHALKQTRDDCATRIPGKVGYFVGDMHVSAIAKGEHMADVHTTPFRLPQRKAQRARLAGDTDARAARLVQTHFTRGKRY